jgi:hypothetical protein
MLSRVLAADSQCFQRKWKLLPVHFMPSMTFPPEL